MKDFLKKKDTNVEATEVTENGMPKFQNPPKVPSPVTFDVPPPKDWKSQRFHSCSEATDFMNENKVNPEFMVPGPSGQIFIFYKA